MSKDFPGGALVRKLEAERRSTPETAVKVLQTARKTDPFGEVWLRHFPDFYGFRGYNAKNPGVFLLSSWEFLMRWEVLRLPAPARHVRCKPQMPTPTAKGGNWPSNGHKAKAVGLGRAGLGLKTKCARGERNGDATEAAA